MTAIAMRDVLVTRWSSTQRASTTLLRDVGWTVADGEHWVVLGPNGAGKTTLLHLASAVTHPTDGTVEVLGHRLGRVDVRELRERIGLVDAATARQLRPRLFGHQVVLTGSFGSIALQRRRIEPAHEARARELLELLGAGHVADRRYETCSQGERQRLLIARALMAEPELLLLDEPAVGLDLPAREQLIAALDALARDRPHLPTVVITHHVEEIPASTSHALLLADGTVVAAGPVADVLSDEHVSACFGLQVRVGHAEGRWRATLAPDAPGWASPAAVAGYADGMPDDETPEVPDDVAAESAFAGDGAPHEGAEEDRSRPATEDLSPEELAEGGPAGA